MKNLVSKKDKPAFLDFFAGSGLVTEALKAYFTPVWANDICPKKAAVYMANHPTLIFHVGPIEQIRGHQIPEATLSWASFPCQDLSLAGNIAGISSPRSGLVWHWLRVMDEMSARPPIIVAENVIGLISAEKGAHYRRLHSSLIERGYRVGAVVINAAYWVPQSRPRVFVIGVDESIDVDEYSGNGPIWCHPTAIQRAASSLPKWIWWRIPKPAAERKSLEDIVDFGASCDPPEKSERNISLISERHHRFMLAAAKAGTRVFPGYKRTRHGKQVLELRFDGLAGCLRTPQGGSSRQVLVLRQNSHYTTRLLTVPETAQLMGVRKSYQIPGSYNDGYKAMGDAVAVPAARHLARSLLAPLATHVWK